MRSLLRICPRTASMRRDFCASRLMDWHVLIASNTHTPERRSGARRSGGHMIRSVGRRRRRSEEAGMIIIEIYSRVSEEPVRKMRVSKNKSKW